MNSDIDLKVIILTEIVEGNVTQQFIVKVFHFIYDKITIERKM